MSENEAEKAAERDRVMDDIDVRDGWIEIPVDQSLLDPTSPVVTGQWEEAPSEVGTEPYPLPDLADAVEQAETAAQAERETAEQVITVRDQQSLTIANMATNGPHFLVNVEGAELCGGCGKPFPCPTWTGEIEPRNLAESSGHPVPDEDKARAVAELLGVPVEQARQIVLMSTPLDQLADTAGVWPKL